MPKPITLQNIAERAGVHRSTVSLCLRNSPSIPDTTKTRVLAIARELGYRPHPFVRTLMHARRRGQTGSGTPPLAFVHIQEPDTVWTDWLPELRLCLDRARQQAQASGFRLEEFTSTVADTRRLGDILYARGIRGAIVGPMKQPVETLLWDWNQLSVVALGPSLMEAGVHRIRNHHFQAMLTAMDECHRLGYRRVGLALKEAVSQKIEHRWLAAYLLKQRQFQIPDPPKPLLTSQWTPEIFLHWLERERPDAIIGGKEDFTPWLTEAGYTIPRDLGLVALNAPLEGPQSGISQNWAMQGERAVTLLVSLLRDNLPGLQALPRVLLVTGQWHPGQTVRPQSETSTSTPSPERANNPTPSPPKSGKRVSLTDVAKKAGLHRSTISLCLNNSPLVAEETKLRIQKIARQLGYRPHPHLRALMRTRRRGLAPDAPPVIAFWTPSLAVPPPGLIPCLESARRHAELAGYHLATIHTSPEKLDEEIRSGDISGLILAPFSQRCEYTPLPDASFATIAIGPGFGEPYFHRVRSNHFKAMLTARKKCRELGYRRVGFALSKEMNRQTDERWLAAWLVPHDTDPAGLLLTDSWNETTFLRWIEETRPEAIIVGSAREPCQWLKNAGWEIPHDIGIAALSVPTPESPQSGVLENWEGQGERSVSMLIDLLLDDDLRSHSTPHISLVNGTWNPGATLPNRLPKTTPPTST